MAQITQNLQAVLDQLQPTLKKAGFQLFESDEDKSEASGATICYSGERGTIRIDYTGEIISLFGTNVASDAAQEGDYKKLSTSLLYDNSSASDIKYVADDFSETIESKFGVKSKAIAKGNAKNFQTVSKAAARSGVAYDATTLASKICLVFPEIRAEYKANIEQYGEFLCEEFFSKYGTPVIVDAIKTNNPTVMKKLFNTLNDIYDNGTNEVQSLIAVTILGQLNNDTLLLANCVDYMSETMAPSVIEINKFFATREGARARKKLENPPPYKPKKKKKSGGLMQTLMGGGTPGLGQQ